jgi:hypothetical protein
MQNLLSQSSDSTFWKIQPVLTVSQSATIEGDYRGFLLKRRKHQDPFNNIYTWVKVFVVLRKEDKTLSWYRSSLDSSPAGILDLADEFTCEAVPVTKVCTFSFESNWIVALTRFDF